MKGLSCAFITGRILLFVFMAASVRMSFALQTPCALRPSAYGYVCVCNATYCDFLEPITPTGYDGFVLTSSSKAGLRFSSKQGQFSNKTLVVEDWADSNEADLSNRKKVELVNAEDLNHTIRIDRSKKYQKIVGFGGAFTGAVSHILQSIPQELQDSIYKSYFSTEGIGYTIIRMPIGGSDFDLEHWAYNELPENDINLSNFTELNHLDEKKIKQIKRLKTIAGIEDIKLMGSAWSPPKWMKDVNSWTGPSALKKEYYQTWAEYHLRFLELMAARNMSIWAITTGNEPMNGVVAWSVIHFLSLGWIASDQAVWVADNLGPSIRNSKFKDVKIFGNEDQRYTFPFWFKLMNETRKESLNYLDALAVHWYTDDYFGPSLIDETHELMPEKWIFNTESCLGDKVYTTHGPELGSWDRAERYARSYFEDFQHSFNGYIDWNIILNEEGGPCYLSNHLDSPIIVNVTSGEEIYKQPVFYAIGHFSKFLSEGSIRIDAKSSNKIIETIGFERPDGTIVCIYFNSASVTVAITLDDSVRGILNITIPPRSFHTIEYK